MAGSRSRRRHRRSARPPQGEPSPPEPPIPRQVTVAPRPSKKTCCASSSTSSATSGPNAWADPLDSLLHQIICLLSSFHDLLAFTGTCRSWRTALSSFPPVYTFTFPPLHLKPDIHYTHPRCNNAKYSLLSNYKWHLCDPAKRTLSLRCSAPRNTPNRMRYLGCSYGYLIFSYQEHCLLVDVYTGTKVKPPKLRSTSNFEIYYGILMAPLNSPNSHLLLCSTSSMFQWQVGTKSWSEHPLGGERILQIVFFKGEMFAMDFLHRLHTIRLAPQLSMQEVAVVWGEDMVIGLHFKPWLVVCGDMLLMVDLSIRFDPLSPLFGTFQVFHLDFSVEPAKWVKMENLGNLALFVSLDRRNPTLNCTSPERWGGKSNFIYVASASEDDSDELWTAVELGQPQPVPCTTHAVSYGAARAHPAVPDGHRSQLDSLWVLPSLAYGVG